MKSYNIVFGNIRTNKTYKNPNTNEGGWLIENTTVPVSPANGWAGNYGPNIPWENWPRNPETKTPMFHILTIQVPEEYRKKSPNLVAISLFQGGGGNGMDETELIPGTEHTKDYNNYSPHPQYVEHTDIIDGKFGHIWLTQEEFNRAPKAPKGDLRTQAEKDLIPEYDEVITPWDNEAENHIPAWLLTREDPNTGKQPNEGNDHGYVQLDYESELWENLSMYSHFGGTMFPVQAMPEFSPFYLEIEEYPGMNLGDAGNLQLDLEKEELDWACG